jgi:hypothetical protein
MSWWLILSLSALFACLALAVDGANLRQARVELRNGSDAAVLAAAQGLVDDDALTNRPGVMRLIVERSREEALAYGLANPVLGAPLQLIVNPEDPLQSDLVYGFKENPLERGFEPSQDLDSPHLNVVRVIAKRSRERGNPAGMYFGRLLGLPFADVVASATAYLDRDLIGFRPLGRQPIPMVPLALLTDPTMTDDEAWETQTLKPTLLPAAQGTDHFNFDRQDRQFLEVGKDVQQGDSLYEMSVFIPLAGQPQQEQDQQDANGCFVFDRDLGDLGASGQMHWESIARQVVNGITAEDLANLDGQFVLGSDNRLILPGIPAAPGMESQDLNTLLRALQSLQTTAEPRVWPLYSSLKQDEKSPGRWQAVVQGFVAARVVKAEVVTLGEKKDEQRQQLRLILQPCMMSTGSAVTDFSRRHANPEVEIYNRYICKVRLVNE